MNNAYATSADGLGWDWHGVVLEGRAGMWDSALPDGGHRIFYEARLPDESHELRTESIRGLTPPAPR